VSFADGKDLLEVMLAVNELKLPPLIDVEWSQDGVARKFALGSEECFGFGAEHVEVSQMFGGGSGELFSTESMGRGSRRHHGRGFAAVREVAETDEGVLAEMLGDAGLSAGGGLLGESGVESQFCAGVAKEEMLHDLLDGPLVRARRGLELRLSGVESTEGEGYLALQAMEG
jgi:hypothetical protein